MAAENCFVLYGDDKVQIQDKARNHIRTYFGKDAPDPVVFDGEGSYEEYKSQIEGQSLFTSNTAIIIKNPFFLGRSVRDENKFKNFINLLEHMAPEVLVVITWDGNPDKRTKVYKAISKAAVMEEYSFLKPKDAGKRLVSLVQERGKQLDFRAKIRLENEVSAWAEVSLPLLESIADKMVLLAGENQTITETVLKDSLPGYMDQGIFTFFEELLNKNAAYILENTCHVFTDIPSELKNLGFISSRFRKFKMAREMRRHRVPLEEIWKAIGVRSQWQWRNMEKEIRKVSEDDAEWMLNEIFSYQYRTRVLSEKLEIRDLFLRYCIKKH